MIARTIALLVLAGTLFVPGAGADKVTATEEIRRTLTYTDASSPHSLLVDNLNGPITIEAYDGKDVRVVARKTISAESAAKLDEAKAQITLDIREEPSKITLYVDAPWRRSDGSTNYRGWRYHGYDVDVEFTIKVPARTAVYASTINRGEVIIRGIHGDYEVQNVNGGVEMTAIDGHGLASTVNGPVHVAFAKNPGDDCMFRTVNGKVEVTFTGDLSAEIRLKTLNGKVYSDYDVEGVAPRSIAPERKHGRTVYRRGESFAVRAGAGGPTLSFDTLNGNIYILKNK